MAFFQSVPGGAGAQSQDPLVMPWVNARPLFYVDAEGMLAGFYVALAAELSDEIGVEIVPEQVPNFAAYLTELREGRAQFAAGVPKHPSITSTAVFSDTVFVQDVRLMVRIEDAGNFDDQNLEGRLIGTIPPIIGDDPALLPGASIVQYQSPSAAVIGLLSGEIDAISAPTYITFGAARAARVDHRVTFTGGSLATYDLYAALHESRADLLDPINAALAKMRSDGRLDTLTKQHAVVLPEPAPDTLTVGVYHFPPYQVITDSGEFTGFAVEVLRDLADRAGLALAFQEINLAQWQAGPQTGSYDMLPQAGINAERRARMDFAYPLEQAELSIFVLAGQQEGVRDLDDLVGRRVGVSATNLAQRLTQARDDLTLITLGDQEDHLDNLLDGRVDAILFPTQPMVELAIQRGVADQVIEIRPPLFLSERAVALRPGLGAVREQLNAVIPGYLVSEDYRQVRETWFGEPVFWTRNVLIGSGLVLGFAILSLGALSGYQWERSQRKMLEFQRRELVNETTYNEQLKTVVHQLERSNENLNDFAYIASHDLKEPLRGIAINADFLLREEVSAASRKRINRMVVLTTRMEQLISDLLFFSRLGREEENREEVNLTKVLGNLKSDLREALEERGGTITIATHLPHVTVERSRVRTVFYNLIMNGITYNDADKKLIEIGYLSAVEVNGKTLSNVFYVKDNGIGIDEKNRDKVYRIFTRLNRESDYGRGSGAGLSFVKKVLEIYDCDLTFASEVGVGTTFYFSLPNTEAKTSKNKEPERTVA